VQTSTCYTTLKIHIWPSVELMGMLNINSELTEKRLLSHIENLYTSQLITPRRKRLFMSLKIVKNMTWHHSHDMMDGVMMHPSNDEFFLIGCILSFQWNKIIYILGYIYIDSIHSGHLLLLILVSWWYLWFTTCHIGGVWGQSSCFYLWSYPILIVQVKI
jgi:hypothetical protein